MLPIDAGHSLRSRQKSETPDEAWAIGLTRSLGQVLGRVAVFAAT